MITITLAQVIQHGSVVEALEAIISESAEYVVCDERCTNGQTFVTSGPGGGYTRQLTVQDYAEAASAKELTAVDLQDGRAYYYDEWTDESIVKIVATKPGYSTIYTFHDMDNIMKAVLDIADWEGVHDIDQSILDFAGRWL